MEKFAKFEVPSEVLGDFIQQCSQQGFAATTSGANRRGEHIVTVPYEKEKEDDVEELKEYLEDLISDTEDYEDEDEEDEDEEDENR